MPLGKLEARGEGAASGGGAIGLVAYLNPVMAIPWVK